MKLDIDSLNTKITCPKCGHKISETIGKLKNQKNIKCVRCSTLFDVDSAALRKTVDGIKKRWDKL